MQILFYVMCMLISNEVCIGCCFACSMFNAHCLNDKTNCVSGFARIQWLKNTKGYNFAWERMGYVRFIVGYRAKGTACLLKSKGTKPVSEGEDKACGKQNKRETDWGHGGGYDQFGSQKQNAAQAQNRPRKQFLF